MMYRLGCFVVALLASLTPAPAEVLQSTQSLFDPARHMHVSEVRPGMTGYGLTVFKGTQIEKFDVEVLSVLKNFNPKYDVVLIRCKGDYLKHTGSIAGMSGSPIYLKDDQGRDRMIGAFAYGWPMTKDPVAGVQPIEYMLDLPVDRHAMITAGPGAVNRPDPSDAHEGLSWSLLDAGLLPFRKSWLAAPAARQPDDYGAAGRLASDPPQLQPLVTPLMAGGLSPGLLKQVSPLFAKFGLTPLQAGGGGSAATDQHIALEPGSVLAVPLLTGDVDLTAIGTVTEVIGSRVFGFGHPFNNEGAIALPMGSGQINGVIPNLQTSFKLGALALDVGCLTTDESVGVAGRVGISAPMVPIDFRVSYANGSPSRTYHFRAALHPKFTPMLAGVALAAAVTGPSDPPQFNTLDYTLRLQFSNGQNLEIGDTAVNANIQDLFGELGIPIMAASDNPFERVRVERISGEVKISPTARQAQILDVNLPRSRFRPGEIVKAYVTYKPFRQAEGIMPVELQLPRDLPQGTYQLIISDAQRWFQDEQQAEPFRFTAGNLKEVFGVLRDAASIRQNAIYLRLLRQPDGVAVGRTALPQLPSSRRQILLGAGRSNITPFVSSTMNIVPTDMVMTGSAEFAITVDPKAKVEVAGAKPAPPAAAPSVPAAKPEQRRKSAAADSDASATDQQVNEHQDH
ncbi:MAG TPA: hypothetical protein VK797_22305 [Tepidisphaeraceae bacterium]|nr:hypothetical protein [Tepidisphaeraceae bacterium]